MRLVSRRWIGLWWIGMFLLLSLRPAAGVGATQQTPRLPHSPLSGGLLMAQAIHSGAVLPSGNAPSAGPAQLTCAPAPCALPNVQASEGGQPVNEDPIAANPNNSMQLLSGGNDYNCISLQGFFASDDAGSTWKHACLSLLSGGSGEGDPIVGYDANNLAYAGGIQSDSAGYHIVVATSSDNGFTWSAPAIAVNPTFSGGIPDKPWLQIDTNPASPCLNHLYISVTQFATTNNSQISVSNSSGSGWTTRLVSALGVYPNVNQFSDLAVGKDGTVYLTWLNCTANGAAGDCGGTVATMMFSESLTCGSTWSSPVAVASVTLTPDPGFCCFYGALPQTNVRVSDIPAVDVDNSTGPNAGHLYVVMYNWTGTQMQAQVVNSPNGVTWSAPAKVAPSDIRNQFFPWLTVSASGTVGVTWLDGKPGPSSETYLAVGTTSTDGVHYLPRTKLATVSSNTKNSGFGGSFMGDYTGNIWVGKTLYASWMDMRSGVNSQDEVGGLLTP